MISKAHSEIALYFYCAHIYQSLYETAHDRSIMIYNYSIANLGYIHHAARNAHDRFAGRNDKEILNGLFV